MKRILYVAGSLALLSSMVVAGNALAFTKAQFVRSARVMTVRLCSSTPVGIPADRQISQGIFNGVLLADRTMKARLRHVGISVASPLLLNDGNSQGSAYSVDKERLNAEQCLSDSTAMGYIGTLNSATAAVSEPLLNKQHMVMISPANTSPSLTSPVPYQGSGGRLSQEPATYHHQIRWVTYYRTVTTDALQGPAGALFVHSSLHARTYYLTDDRTLYGAGLANSFDQEASRLHMRRLGRGSIDSSSTAAEAQTAQSLASTVQRLKPDVVYCGCDAETSGTYPQDLRRDGYTKPFVGGDAIENTLWVKTTAGPHGAVNNWATSVGPPPTSASTLFRTLYRRYLPSFYRNPGIQAYDAPAYDAARIVLTAIYEAAVRHQLHGSLIHMRTVIVHNVRFINYYGAIGHTRFDSNGDTTNRILSVYRANVGAGTFDFVKEIKPKGFKPCGC